MIIDEGDVYIFNLLNGYEIIATVAGSFDSSWHLTNAYVLVIKQASPNGPASLGMSLPAQFGESNRAGQNITIPFTAVAFYYKPNDEINDAYVTQRTGIDLSQAKPGIIV